MGNHWYSSVDFQVMSATAPSPTTTSVTNTAHNMKSQVPFSMHNYPHDDEDPDHHDHHPLSPLSPTNSVSSSPLYSGCGPHDDSVAFFRAEHDPQSMSTPVKESSPMPQQSTPLGIDTTEAPQEADETDLTARESIAKKEDEPVSVGKRKRDSLESIDCSTSAPEGRVTRSVKRLKRLNTTAKKGLRRNLSFNAMKSPFTSLLRRGRSSMMDTSITTSAQSTESDATEPDCGAAMPLQEPLVQSTTTTTNSLTFKTPIAPSPINNNATAGGAAASTVVAATASSACEWRDSVCLPEIQEEEGSSSSSSLAVIAEPEGKSAAADPPGVEYNSLLNY